MPIGLNDTDIEVDYGGGNIFNVDIPKYLVTTTTEVSDEEIPIVNKDVLTRTQYNYGSDVTSGLVAHYKFDGDLTDSSGNGNDITIVSGTIDYHFNYKVNGQSSLIGANEYIEITSLNVLTAVWSGAFTISFWLYPTTSDKEYLGGGWDNAISAGGLRGGWYITARNGNLEWQGLTGGNFISIIGTDNNIVANAWNHISISNTGTTFNISLNGIIKTLTTSNTLDTPHTNLADRHIGISRAKKWSGSGYDYDNNGGYYDDFRVYNRVLSTTEITNLYNLGAINIEEGDISGTNDKYIAYKYIGGNDNGSGQSEYNLQFNNPALCDILVVAGGGAGGGNGQAGGGGAGALIYYEDIILQGDYTIKVGNGGTNGNTANVGDSGSDSEFKRTSDGKQQFLAKGGGGGGTWNNSGYKPLNGGSGGGGAGDSTSGKLIAGNIVNDIAINIVTGSATLVDHYNITMFPGDNGVDSLNDIGCFGNYGGIEMSGGHDDWGAGGGGAGTKGDPTSESMGIQYAGDGGSGKKYNITGTDVYYAAGGGGGIRPNAGSLSTAQVGTGGLGGGGAGGGGGDNTANSALDSSGVDADPHTGSGGGGVGAVTTANYKGGDGGSGIIIIRYKNENISSDVYIPQGNNATEYTILDCDNTNLVAHYKFDEDAEYRDSVYGYYDLIDLDNTSLFSSTEKVFGKSAHESGTEAKIQFPDLIASQISEISSTTGITFSFWFNMNTSSGSKASLFEFSDTESDTTLTNRIGIERNGTANSIWIGIKEDNVETSITCGVVDNEWHHITWSIDNKGTWTIYFDGVNQYPNKYKQIPQIHNYDYSYLFGSVQSSQTIGYIDDFRIYNKVLNSLEITYLANKSIKFAPKEIDSEYNLLTFLYHDELADDNQTEYNLTFDSPTECDILIVGGGGAGGYATAGGGGAGGLVFQQNVSLTGQVNIKVGKGGVINSDDTIPGGNGSNSSINDIIALGGGGGAGEQSVGSDGGSGGGSSYSYSDSHYGDGLQPTQTPSIGYGNRGGDARNLSSTSTNRGGGGGGGAGGVGLEATSQSVGGAGGVGLSGIGSIDFKEHFGLSTSGIGEYIPVENKIYFAGGGGAGECIDTTSGATNYGLGGKGGGSDGKETDNTIEGAMPNSGGGGGGGGNVYLASRGHGSNGGSGIILVRYKRNMGTPTITTTTELAQWKYSATNANVVHKGNVGIGTFPLTNYNLNVKGDINTNNLYKDGCLISSGKIREPEYTFPYFTSTPNVSSTYITGTSYKYITFVYDPDNDKGSNQTEYSFNVLSNIQCDILIVGGGGGGGAFGGGGGGGGLLFAESVSLEGSNEYTIKVANGGAGAPTFSNGVNGTDGYDSSININGSDYIAVGGGGGGTRKPSPYNGTAGNAGGSGGGGSHSNGSAVAGGTSTQLSYEGWVSYGNSGGKGRNGTGGGNPNYSSGGGGGAGYQGEDAIQSTQGDRTWSAYGGGGDGGIGVDFSSYFGTNVGHNGWFAGGGGGNTFSGAGRVGWGNSYNGTHDNIRGFGGGGDGGFNGSPVINPQKGIEHTGGGGGGAQTGTAGASGGSGVVIIRYLDTGSFTNEPTITNNADCDILVDGYNTIMLTYDSTNDNGNNQTNYTLNVTSDMSCEVLIVSGGGGGGVWAGGGGGGGGVIHLETLSLKAGVKTISVGNGGDGAPAAGSDGQSNTNPTINAKQGANSVFDTYIAIGGGYGGSGKHDIYLLGKGGPGGSGGGSSGFEADNNLNDAGVGTLGQGFRGAYGKQSHYSGGGGGAGEIGGGGEDGAAARQRGGDGLQFDILGTPYYWGGGGGGSGHTTIGGNGGKGGGGGGAIGTTYGGTGGINDGEPGGGGPLYAEVPGGDAGEHTGGGGGGGPYGFQDNRGGNGGSGVVIIKYSTLYELTTTNDIDYTLSLIDANKTTDDIYNIMSFKHIDNIISDMHPTFSQDAAHLIAHYKFDGNYEDSNPQSTKYHLTNVDTELVIDGNIKSVLIDNDADELYTTNNMPAITSTSAYSWCCWVKRNEERHGVNHFVFSQGVNSSTTEIGVAFVNNNSLRFYVHSFDLDITIAFNDTAVISRYNHFVFTINNNTTKIYENGILRGSRSVSANIATNKLYIGKTADSSGSFRGNVADFRVYDKELSADEVYELYTLYNGQTQYSVTFNEPTECDILVVAGGGGGGGTDAGGGGAGGLIYETGLTLNGTYTIKVGNGGVGGAGGANVGNNPGLKGKNSQIQGGNTIINYDAVGGGGGGSGYPNDLEPYTAGGGSSGGLGTSDTTRDPANVHVDGQGYSGGIGVSSGAGGGGGGGAGGVGGDGLSAVGGIGREIDITGTATYYAGGGGGGHSPNKDGGLGGGGRGSQEGNGLDATFYGGGGGGGGGSWGAGGDAYEGIVIIRYKATLSNPITYKLKEWKYNTLNANTKFMGKVGIGTNNPSGEFEVAGSITKTSINFKIQHPLNENKWLQHGSLEGPRYDNIYRGKKVISGGYSEINIDIDCNTSGGMATGTFAALNGNPFLYLRNNQTYDRVIGEIDNGIIKVNCENTIDDIEIEWMVIGERKDNAVKRLQITDNQGRLLCERQL
jgi:hypothetical protein